MATNSRSSKVQGRPKAAPRKAATSRSATVAKAGRAVGARTTATPVARTQARKSSGAKRLVSRVKRAVVHSMGSR
ncbi:hypothetical protein WDW37_02105 [Bdellovibrionota bacterium FG-1]